MQWMEIIEVRVLDKNRALIEEHVQRLISELDRDIEKITLNAYNKFMVMSDMSIHLYHQSINPEGYGSTLGLRLASNLKEFGLVHHSVWIEMQNT